MTTAALVISWLVSVYFVPYLGWLAAAHAQQVDGEAHEDELFDTPFYTRFRRTVDWCVQHRWITIGLTVLSFALGIVGMGRVQQQFFPDSSRPEILVDLWLPEGSTIQQSDEVARRFEARLMQEPGRAERHHLDRQRRAALLPAAGPDLPAEQRQPGHRAAQGAGRSARRCASACRSCWRASSPRCAAASSCCPTGRRCLIRCSSASSAPTPAQVRAWADRAKERAARQPEHARRQRQLERSRSRCCAWTIDQDKARALGVTSQAIAQASRTILSGSVIGQYREGDKLIDIVLRQPLDERSAHHRPGQRLPAHGQRPRRCR